MEKHGVPDEDGSRNYQNQQIAERAIAKENCPKAAGWDASSTRLEMRHAGRGRDGVSILGPFELEQFLIE